MKNVCIFLMLFLLISCEERNQNKTVQAPKITSASVVSPIQLDTTQLAVIKDSLVLLFYKKNQKKTFWITDSIRKKVVYLLQNVASDGLLPKEYNLNQILGYEAHYKSLADSAKVSYDILLTQNLNRYIHQITSGRLDPKNLYHNWDLKENKINYKELLLQFKKKDSFDLRIKSLAPSHIVYKHLKQALAIINTYPEESFQKVVVDTKLVLNDTNEVLKIVKNKLFYWKDLKSLDSLTPVFDLETERALKKFQIRHGLNPDGVIGKETVKALNISQKQRKEQVLINMERWRWYPRTFEKDYLIINIPNYSLHVMAQQDTAIICKVIVGKFKRQTPILSSKLSYLVLNPTWTVPPTILEEDIVPAIKRDSTYLSRKNILVYDDANKLVDAANWDVEKAATYRYVQGIGGKNALGLVKFIFPNRFTIYLHDTNNKTCFNFDYRALSSGCIRVQDPLKLAEYILDDSRKWNDKKLREIIKEGVTKEITSIKKMDIHIFYWTAWSENGSLQFRDDIYKLDRALYKEWSDK